MFIPPCLCLFQAFCWCGCANAHIIWEAFCTACDLLYTLLCPSLPKVVIVEQTLVEQGFALKWYCVPTLAIRCCDTHAVIVAVLPAS